MASLVGAPAVPSPAPQNIAIPSPPSLPALVGPCLPHRVHPIYGSFHFPQCDGILPTLQSTSTVSSSAAQSATHTESFQETAERELVEAVMSGDVSRVSDLLKTQGKQNLDNQGQDSSNEFSFGRGVSNATGLGLVHYAASRGHLEVLQLLVERTSLVDVDVKDREGETPLLKAAYNGHTQVVRYLLSKNANVNQQDSDGWSALHNCASRGHLFAARAIIEGGADVNAKSRTGHTPLMSASAKGFLDLVELLLNNKADPLVKNNFGDTAYDLAAQSEEAYICEVLQMSEQDILERLSRNQGQRGPKHPLMAQHNTVVEVIHENQRSGFLSRQFSVANLSKNDIRGPWSSPAGRPCTLEDVHLPLVRNPQSGQLVRGWFWLTDWRVDTKHPRVDPVEGWQYAKAFEEPDAQWTAAPIGSTLAMTGWVRRRRWIRVRKRRVDDTPGSRGEQDADGIDGTDDYVARAQALVQNIPQDAHEGDMPMVKDELRLYEEAIAMLLTGIKSEKRADVKRMASSLVTSYLEHAEQLNTLINTVGEEEEEEEEPTGSPAASNSKGKLPLGGNGGQPSTQVNQIVESTSDTQEQLEVIDEHAQAPSPLPFGEARSMAISAPINPLSGTISSAPLAMSPISSWQPDDEAPQCSQCQRRFTIWLRRHHCRWCGRIFCANCTASRLALFPNTAPHRVCDSCFVYLSNRNAHSTPPSTPTHMGDPPSPSRSAYSAAESIMNECPVCQASLDHQDMSEEEMEAHVADCLDRVATGRGQGQLISGNRYVGG
ncbi:hypothetical protein SpCBS45565_g07976 [Spizellomyces sp. 'palustris']|nr:hypothetical protein SpCBS45565_g07976 [Spizellomyces sp. 'palustris']